MPYLFNGILSDVDRLLGDRRRSSGAEVFPIDIEETDDAYILRAGLPGVRSDDVDLLMDRDVLTISVRRATSKEGVEATENGRYLVRERRQVSGSRSVSLPYATASQEVEASLTDGVLTVTIRKEQAKRSRKIAIRNG
jgi:HSP20 family protein